LITAFRWETGHIYFQAFKSQPGSLVDLHAIYAMLYGWNVKEPGAGAPDTRKPLANVGPERPVYFVRDLILLYLFRNELAIAKPRMNLRYSSAGQTRNVTEGWTRSLGSKQKYGELYTWAMLIPYIQGVLLYLLAMAYPFACVAMVVPGWHKTLITWGTFYLWVKLWDLGYAIVGSVEKSLWAMFGNGASMVELFDRIVNMADIGHTQVSCDYELEEFVNVAARRAQMDCAVPGVFVTMPDDTILQMNEASWKANLEIFDLAMVMGPNLDLDLQNAYYIYIMAALYFAVPAVTGQLVLGAKAGAASMVSGAIGSSAQSAGQAAGSGYQGDVSQRTKSNQASIGHAAMGKAFRSQGLASQALGSQNQAADNRVDAAGHGIKQQSLDKQTNANALATQDRQRGSEATLAAGKAFIGATGGSKSNGNLGDDTGTGATGTNATGTGRTGTGNDGGGTPDASSPPLGNTSTSDYVNQGGAANGGSPFMGGVQREAGKMKGGSAALGKIANTAEGLHAVGNAQMWRGHNADAVKMSAAGMDHGIQGQGSSLRAAGHDSHAGRAGAHAQYGADMARWEAMNDYANQMGPMATALGIFAGGLDPGAKPTEMNGMAMSGALNSYNSDGSFKKGGNMQGRANHFNPQGGAYFQAVNSAFGKRGGDGGALGRSHGGQSIRDSYSIGSNIGEDAAHVQVGQAASAAYDAKNTLQGQHTHTGDHQTNRGKESPRAIQDGSVK
jgi:hypothetical protein